MQLYYDHITRSSWCLKITENMHKLSARHIMSGNTSTSLVWYHFYLYFQDCQHLGLSTPSGTILRRRLMVEEVTFGDADESRCLNVPRKHESAVSRDEVEENNRVDVSVLCNNSDLMPIKQFHPEGDDIPLLEAETTPIAPSSCVASTADSSKSTQHVSAILTRAPHRGKWVNLP